MEATASLSVEEYLHTSYEPKCEYVDGVLLPKSMPTWEHALLQVWVASLIMRLFPQFAAGAEVRTKLRETEYRVPDISVDYRERATGYAEKPIYLAIEILSPDERIGKTFAKCELYHDWGVPYCWVVDPVQRRAWSYAKGSLPAERSTLEAGEITLPLEQIFSILDQAPQAEEPDSQ
jgi:Uma2 family endonuclease